MHFVTYRLTDTIPLNVLQHLREQRQAQMDQPTPEDVSLGEQQERVHKRFFADFDRYLDRTCRIDWLSVPTIAALIRGNLYHHRGSKYHLLSYCVMPNHVHVLLQPLAKQESPPVSLGDREDVVSDEKADALGPLAVVMHSLKSYTAHKANDLLGRSGPFWQSESYDHWVRDDEELVGIVDYIAWNPVKAKLVELPHQWFFSSAHDRFLQDGSSLGFLC